MEHKTIAFYDHYACLCGACPATCCKGWQIIIDEETYENIKKEPGELGKKLRRKIRGKEPHFFNEKMGGCPCYTKEGLCDLQAKERLDLVSFVCQEYPRRILEFGIFTETTLELSCIAVAKVFLEHFQEIQMIPAKEAPKHIMWKMDNEDPEFLSFLLELRTKVTSEIEACESFDVVVQKALYQFFENLHEEIVRNRLPEAKKLLADFKLPKAIGGKYLFLPMEMIDKIIAYNLDSKRLYLHHPQLKQMLRWYYQYFNKLTEQEAKEFYHRNREQMLERHPEFSDKYRAYYQYYLQEMLLTTYEDYHVLRAHLLGTVYLQIYMLFDLVAYLHFEQKGEDYDVEKQAMVLSNLERRMRHNQGITDGIMGRLRKDFL